MGRMGVAHPPGKTTLDFREKRGKDQIRFGKRLALV